MVKLVKIFLLVCFVIGITDVGAQPFSNEIATFKKQDAVSFPEKQEILFVGSSSFRMWKDVQTAFPNHTIINRGFGGSSLPDVIRYADEIIFPYQPKQIVIYCGENDIASSDTVTGEMTRDRFKILFEMIRNKLPDVPVVFVSIKPSPSRWTMQDRMITANKLIKNILRSKRYKVRRCLEAYARKGWETVT